MTRSGQKARCAVVGLGRIGSTLEGDRLREKPATHAGAIVGNRDCQLVGGCDPEDERREAFSRRWHCPHVFSDTAALLGQTRPEILHIATPPDTHREIVEEAVRAGVQVLICEKPLAETIEDAEAIARIHREGSARILTNHERRYSRDYLRVRRLIEEEHFGPLVSIASRLCIGRTRQVQTMLLHDGTHMLDIIAFLSATPLDLMSADMIRSGKTEVLLLAARAGEVAVQIEVGGGRDHLIFELDLSFENGRVRIGNGLYEEQVSRKSPYYEKMRSLKRLPVRRPRVTGYFSGMMADAVRCVRDPAYQPVSTAPDGHQAMVLLQRITEATAVSPRVCTKRRPSL